MEFSSKDTDLSDFGAEYIRAIGEELKCRICLLHLRDPQVANCSHSFCKQCIQKGFETMPKSKREKNSWTCPLCKAPFNRRAIKSDEVTNNLVTEFFNLARSFENLHQRNDMFSQEQPIEDSPKVVVPASSKNLSTNHKAPESSELVSRSIKNDSSSKTLVDSETSGFNSKIETSEIGHNAPESTVFSTSEPEKHSMLEKEPPNLDLSGGLPNISSLFKTISSESTNLKSISHTDSTLKGNNTQHKELADLLFPEDSSKETSAPSVPIKTSIKKTFHKKETSVAYLRNSRPSSGIGSIQIVRSKKIPKTPKKQKLNPEIPHGDLLLNSNETHGCDRILDSSPLPSISNSPNFLLKECSFNSPQLINCNSFKSPNKENSNLASRFNSKNSEFSFSSIELLRKENTISSIGSNESPSKVKNILSDFSFESSPICNKLPNILNSSNGLLRESDLSGSSESSESLVKRPRSFEFPNREDSTGLILETMNLGISKANYPPPNQLALFDSSWSQTDSTQTSRIFNDSKGLHNISPTQVLNHTQPMITQPYENTQSILKEFGAGDCLSPSKNKENSAFDIASSRNNSGLASEKNICESSLKFAGTPFSQTKVDVGKHPAKIILDEELDESRNCSKLDLSNSDCSKSTGYLKKVLFKNNDTESKDFLGTPFFTPVQIRRKSNLIIFDSELEESSKSPKNTSLDFKGPIQYDSSHVLNESCSSKPDESNDLICGTPFSDLLKKDFKVNPNIILDEELLDNGSGSSSLPRFSSS